MNLAINKETIRKFDVPGPRYTSYPTAPNWNRAVDETIYRQKLRGFGLSDKTVSLYFHIPFCETMCAFCACSVHIRPKREDIGEEYVTYILKELAMVSTAVGRKASVKQWHWGGGTPTFLSERQIERLFQESRNYFDIDLNGEIAVEIDPRTITKSKLTLLRNLGFNRVSLGVQDFNSSVQMSINRIQPFEMVEKATRDCRRLGFQSINFDLIYGLPHQTREGFKETMEMVCRLRPDRVALYSFAYVPWLKRHQTKIDPASLPDNGTKLDIFLYSREKFNKEGYLAIAMDHFALQDDDMAKAYKEHRLYRNFMGYTVKPADEYIGCGVSAIGHLEKTFIQNRKVLKEYYAELDKERLPVERGLILERDDLIRQYVISSFMCTFSLNKDDFRRKFSVDFDSYFADELGAIKEAVNNGLLVEGTTLTVTELGKIFIRNVCMIFDQYLKKSAENAGPQFSKTV